MRAIDTLHTPSLLHLKRVNAQLNRARDGLKLLFQGATIFVALHILTSTVGHLHLAD